MLIFGKIKQILANNSPFFKFILLFLRNMNGFGTSSINVGGKLLSMEQPLVMGIVNVTPDSFHAASRVQTEGEILARARQMVADGAQILDVGAFSTRPGAQPVPPEVETARLETALRIIKGELPEVPVSVDTFRPSVAERCVTEWGADIVNDVGTIAMATPSADDERRKEEMFRLVARLKVPYILMSSAPTMDEMMLGFARDVDRLYQLGQKDIILDPGFGFGKTREQNFDILHQLDRLKVFRLPVLVGLSRKSMLRQGDADTDAQLLAATMAANEAALQQGADILRVHDVKEAAATIRRHCAAQCPQ